jgi:sugar transferase EpsL
VINRTAGAVLLALLSPIIAVIGLLVRLVDGPPMVFRQQRAGQDGVPFYLFKFRTMEPPSDGRESDQDRITRVGRFLRVSSIDELPSLWNVVRGEMNLVGPRPLPIAYTQRYSAGQARRLEVRPGLTGWLQVRGRNALSWDEKFALDVWYVEHRSWRLDLRILAETPLAVIRGSGVSHPGHVTMPVFTGSKAAPGGAGGER